MHLFITNSAELTFAMIKLNELGYRWASGHQPANGCATERLITQNFERGADAIIDVDPATMKLTWKTFEPNLSTSLRHIEACTPKPETQPSLGEPCNCSTYCDCATGYI